MDYLLEDWDCIGGGTIAKIMMCYSHEEKDIIDSMQNMGYVVYDIRREKKQNDRFLMQMKWGSDYDTIIIFEEEYDQVARMNSNLMEANLYAYNIPTYGKKRP